MIEQAGATGIPAGQIDSNARPARAMILAIVTAAVLLVTTVLPAEYGIDPTGLGRVLGLTKMGERKQAPAAPSIGEAKAATLPQPAVATTGAATDQHATMSALPLRLDEIEVKLAPNGEIEYKALLAAGELMSYTWDAAGAQVEFDFHGEPSAGPEGTFLSFQKGTASKSGGSLKAPFAGTHGWWWKNRTQKHVVIKLRVSGFYSSIKRQ